MYQKSQLRDWHFTVLYNLMVWGIIESKFLDQLKYKVLKLSILL